MRLWPWRVERKTDVDLNTLIGRLEAALQTVSGVSVTPETCMQSPTVNSIVTSVARRISVSPIRVMRKSFVGARETKELLPNHPVARLLQRPNDYQTRTSYMLDATSSLMRYGRYLAFKSRGRTGPIRYLHPLMAGSVTMTQDDETLAVSYRARLAGGGQRDFGSSEIHHVRGPARDFLEGDSSITDLREAIALEIAIEKHGAAFFGNGALPLLVFGIEQGFKGFATEAEEQKFIDSIKTNFSGRKRFSSFFRPKGISVDQIEIDHAKSQLIEVRKYQRTVIAGGFGVPPHFVGDLERATFNNVEQQDTDFVINVVLPIAQMFESAMERDLLTDDDRRDGVIIRFNLEAVQRADFKSQQEGLKIQREMGVISANDWRERINLNPLSDDDGGDDYIRPMNMTVAGEEPDDPEPPGPIEEPNDDDITGSQDDDD